MTDIEMPRLSDSMEQGTILKWLIADGDPVSDGEELLEIETDKATMTYAAEATGILQIAVQEGETVPVGTVIARVALANAAGQDGSPEQAQQPAPPQTHAEPAAPPQTHAEPAVPPQTHAEPAAALQTHTQPAPTVTGSPNGNGQGPATDRQQAGRVVSTPLARRIAEAHGVDIATVFGSGPHGRITKPDVLAAAGLRSVFSTAGGVGARSSTGEASLLRTAGDEGSLSGTITEARTDSASGGVPASSASGADQATSVGAGTPPAQTRLDPQLEATSGLQAATEVHRALQPPRQLAETAVAGVRSTAADAGQFQPFTPVQRLIASRMSEVKATVPEFQITVDARLDEALALRASLKSLGEQESCPSLNDFIVKACALALRAHPRVNASFADGGLLIHGRINVGIAVSADDLLLVPTIFDADLKSLGAIAQESRSLARRARSGEITPRELEGGTFTVSNLGMFGVSAMTPVLNPGQAAILGVGQTRTVLQRIESEIVESHVSSLTLTCDHRVIYGAHAAHFLADVKALLEAPLRLAL